jgi:hypothetical protein
MTTIYRNSIGVRLIVDTKIDLSTASLTALLIKKPSNTVATWNTVIQDATNGIIYYDVLENDLNEEGIYILQSYVESGTSRFYGESVKFHVRNMFDYNYVKWVQ